VSPHLSTDPAAAQRRELLRILQSQPFARAGRLRQLVTWLAERAIAGHTAKPSEYTVGVEALGKAPDFEPSFDVSVRQLKRRMCARLASYYTAEGRSSHLRLVCERGFAVRFELAPHSQTTLPCIAVLPVQGDESGILAGTLSHALHEAGCLQIISCATIRDESPRRLIEHYAVNYFVEGEILQDSDRVWEWSLRLLGAASGLVLAGIRLTGSGPVSTAALRDAALSLRAHILD
jgi:hypothetical protein